LFTLWPLPVQPSVTGSASVMLVPSWTTHCSALGCYGASSHFDHSLFNVGLLAMLLWCLFPFWPQPVQLCVTGSASCDACSLFDGPLLIRRLLAVLHIVIVRSLTTLLSVLGYWQCFCGDCSFFVHSLFSRGVPAVLHMVLVPSLTSRCLALGSWQCFICGCSLFEQLRFSLGLLSVFQLVLVPTLTSPFSALCCYCASCGACSIFDQSLFSFGLLAVLHVVLVPSLTSPCSSLCYWQCLMCLIPSLCRSCSALGYWQCFMWCSYPLWPVLLHPCVTGSALCGAYFPLWPDLFSLGLIAMLHLVWWSLT
jgi:hypothetical protein